MNRRISSINTCNPSASNFQKSPQHEGVLCPKFWSGAVFRTRNDVYIRRTPKMSIAWLAQMMTRSCCTSSGRYFYCISHLVCKIRVNLVREKSRLVVSTPQFWHRHSRVLSFALRRALLLFFFHKAELKLNSILTEILWRYGQKYGPWRSFFRYYVLRSICDSNIVTCAIWGLIAADASFIYTRFRNKCLVQYKTKFVSYSSLFPKWVFDQLSVWRLRNWKMS